VPIYANQDLVAQSDEMEGWNTPLNRRASFHNLHRIIRYGFSVRAPDVLKLTSCIDARIAELGSVQQMCSSDFFSAMVVLRGEQLVYEQYAPDFAPHQAHTIMSITKTMTHLIMGRCVEDGLIDLNAKVCDYLPEIGSGYADAIIQNVLDMNIVNDYSEDYSDLHTTALLHNASMGWRLPAANVRLTSNREFLCTIGSNDLLNHSGEVNYKSASTDVLAWIAERVSGQALRDHLIRIVEAAGIERGKAKPFDGRSVWPAIQGGKAVGRDGVVIASPQELAVLRGRWKYIRSGREDSQRAPRLFDVVKDPGETTDLAGEKPDLVGELDKATREFLPMMANVATRGRGPGGSRSRRGSPWRNDPLLIALDEDRDSQLSAAELGQAEAKLQALDKNSDGKLSADELGLRRR